MIEDVWAAHKYSVSFAKDGGEARQARAAVKGNRKYHY